MQALIQQHLQSHGHPGEAGDRRWPRGDDIRSLMFGDYMASKDEERMYDEIKEVNELREVM